MVQLKVIESFSSRYCSNPKCSKVNPQPIENFSPRGKGQKLRKQCKTCVKKSIDRWVKSHKKLAAKYQHNYYVKNKNTYWIKRSEWRKKNRWNDRQVLWKQKGLKNADGSFFKYHDYEVMFAQQGNKCAICRSENHGNVNWNADHDHKTGFVRGILCHCCNSALGYSKDSISTLMGMIEYLKRSRTNA